MISCISATTDSSQYRESDLDYCRRLLAEEGLSFRFSHDQNAVAGDEATHARHRLEIFDRETALPELAQPALRFHRNNATEASDTVQTWQEIRNALPNAVTIAGWDYKTLLATGKAAPQFRKRCNESTERNQILPFRCKSRLKMPVTLGGYLLASLAPPAIPKLSGSTC